MAARRTALPLAVMLALTTAAGPGQAAEVHVAVAANFTAAAREVAAAFEQETGDTAVLSFGSTGQLFTQIVHGAPFDVFLAADQARPERAVAEGYAVGESRFTYATGRIALYSIDPDLVTGEPTLADASFDKIALANPETAPYGAAAIETMRALGVHDTLAPRIVRGSNIAQAYQFVATGSAELGFVALSQIATVAGGSRWVVPQHLYAPISQDAVILATASDNGTARHFMTFLEGPKARAIIARYGYGLAE
tara:strand:- start:282 stop:1037 length:756 start_codon:yes stop_codon:yes gene_type:complete